MKKIAKLNLILLAGLFLTASSALAHVVVHPNEVGVGAFQTFTVGVPNEKDNPTIALRLLIPEGLGSVSPNVKPGWKIDIKKTGDGDNAKVTEIDWTAGSIPAGERDDFLFSAQVPAQASTLSWLAYQTYQNGEVVSWDQQPKTNMTDSQREEMEKTGKGPYSETKIVNDLASASLAPVQTQTPRAVNTSLLVSIVALGLSALALGLQFMKRS